MKIKNIVTMLALSGTMCVYGQTSLPAFTGIEIDAPFKVQLIQSTENKVETGGYGSKVVLKVEKDILHIENDGIGKDFGEPLKIYFTQLKSIEANSAVEINTEENSEISGEEFSLKCNGASKAKLKLAVKKLIVESNGAAKMTLSGVAENAHIEMNGAAKLYASDLKCKDLSIEGAGATYFNVNASNSLLVEASGATKGVYSGNPLTKNINVSGVSKIVDANTGDQMSDERIGNGDTTRISIGNKKVIIIEEGNDITIKKDENKKEDERKPKKAKRYSLKHVYSGLELGVSSFASPKLDFNMAAPNDYLNNNVGKSWFYGINPLETDIQIIKNKLAVSTGFGIEFQHFELSNDKYLRPNSSGLISDSSADHLTRNRLYNFNINVPLFIKFAPRTQKTRNGFHIAAGLIGTYKAYSHTKLETSANGFEQETTLRDDFNINPFRVAATVRVGYGWFRAFANYSLTPYFKQTNGNPDIRVFAAGITLIPFQ
ncbi:MAG: DUF2807 domain-containing protein [Bacteroidota bacterium]|nr:DUF2807 domain-containing protein [Bacteroidota bacterium]